MLFKMLTPNTLLAADAGANPVVIFSILGGIAVLALLFAFLMHRRKVRKHNKRLLNDSSFYVEVEAARNKRELQKALDAYAGKEHYNSISGYIPGAEPELSFIDPLRNPRPVETVTVRETMPAAMEIPRDKNAASLKAHKATNTYPEYAPNISMPLHIPTPQVPVPPVVAPVPDVSTLKMPITVSGAPIIPPMPKTIPVPERNIPIPPTVGTAAPQAAKPAAPHVASVAAAVVAAAPATAPAAKTTPEPIPEPKIAMAAPVEKVNPLNPEKEDTRSVTIDQTPVAFAAKTQKKKPVDEYSVSETLITPKEEIVIDEPSEELDTTEPMAKEPLIVPTVSAPASEAIADTKPAVSEPISEEPKSKEQNSGRPRQTAPIIIPVYIPTPTYEEPEEIKEPLVEEMDIPAAYDEKPSEPIKESPDKNPKKAAPKKTAPMQNPYGFFPNQGFDFSANSPYSPYNWQQNFAQQPAPATEPQQSAQSSQSGAPENETQAPEKQVVVLTVPDEIKEMYKLSEDDF